MYEELDELLGRLCAADDYSLEDVFDMPEDGNSELIERFENEFDVVFPDDYKYFLGKYGGGGFGFINIFGLETARGALDECSLAKMTAHCRAKGMPVGLVVIENQGDYVTCIDTLRKAGRAQIVTWSWLDMRRVNDKADSFLNYLIKKIRRCV